MNSADIIEPPVKKRFYAQEYHALRALDSAVGKSMSSFNEMDDHHEMDDHNEIDDNNEMDNNDEADLSEENQTQASQILLAVSGGEGEYSVCVGDKIHQVDDLDLLDTLEDDPVNEHDHIRTPRETFVKFFAQINIIRNYTTTKYSDKKFEQEGPARWVAVGTSRNPPTRFLFCCQNKPWGCTFETKKIYSLDTHVKFCNVSQETPFVQKEGTFACRTASCNGSFGTKGSRNQHEDVHTWQPKKCEEADCTESEVFASRRSSFVAQIKCGDVKWKYY